MIEKVFFFTVVLFTFNTGSLLAQISGISNSKVVVPGTETVGVGIFEFEPAFEVFSSSSEWDSNGILIPDDSLSTESSHGYRFTTGVKKNIEVGVIFPSDATSLNFGLKWLFMKREDLTAAIQTGINFDAANGTVGKNEGWGKVFGGGFIATYEPEGNYSIDSDISFSFYANDIEGQSVKHSGTFDIGASYKLSENFFGVAEYNFNWISFENKDSDSEKGNGLLGFTFNASELTKVIMGLKHDMHGSNNTKGVTYIAAFTFII